MSICIAWRLGRDLHLASDSRYSNDHGICDTGLKVFQIPIRISAARHEGQKTADVIYQGSWGLAIAGDVMPGFILKERIEQVLYNLQYIGVRDELVFDKIARICAHVYECVIASLGEVFLKSTDVLLTGCCPIKGDTHTVKITLDEDANICFEPFLTDRIFGYTAIGSNVDEFSVIVQELLLDPKIDKTRAVLRALRKMVRHNSFKAIGGPIQYGVQTSHDFTKYGVMDFENVNGRLEPVLAVGGINIDNLQPLKIGFEYHAFFISSTAIAPFQDLIEYDTSLN